MDTKELTTKTCNMCGEEKSLKEFATDRGRIIARCRLCHAEKSREYRRDHAERVKVTERKRHEKRYAIQRDDILVRNRAWALAHPETVKTILVRCRCKKAGIILNDLTTEEWSFVLYMFDSRCAYCRGRLGPDAIAITIDHITPTSRGGQNTLPNVVPCCQSCNSRKSAGDPLCPIQPLLGLKFV